jgi:hypothetical protein
MYIVHISATAQSQNIPLSCPLRRERLLFFSHYMCVCVCDLYSHVYISDGPDSELPAEVVRCAEGDGCFLFVYRLKASLTSI